MSERGYYIKSFVTEFGGPHDELCAIAYIVYGTPRADSIKPFEIERAYEILKGENTNVVYIKQHDCDNITWGENSDAIEITPGIAPSIFDYRVEWDTRNKKKKSSKFIIRRSNK